RLSIRSQLMTTPYNKTLPQLSELRVCKTNPETRRRKVTSFRLSLPGALVPLAAIHTHGTTTTSARFRNNSRSSRSPHNPIPDTCAAARRRAAFPAVFRSRDESSSCDPPRPAPAQWSGACRQPQKAFHRHLRHLLLPER